MTKIVKLSFVIRIFIAAILAAPGLATPRHNKILKSVEDQIKEETAKRESDLLRRDMDICFGNHEERTYRIDAVDIPFQVKHGIYKNISIRVEQAKNYVQNTKIPDEEKLNNFPEIQHNLDGYAIRMLKFKDVDEGIGEWSDEQLDGLHWLCSKIADLKSRMRAIWHKYNADIPIPKLMPPATAPPSSPRYFKLDLID